MAPSSTHQKNEENKTMVRDQRRGSMAAPSVSRSRASSRSAPHSGRAKSVPRSFNGSACSLAVSPQRCVKEVKSPGIRSVHALGRDRCYDQPKKVRRQSCQDVFTWNHGKYCKDECGSGIVPRRFDFKPSRSIWCKTPLTMYQATIGELGRQILCREKCVPRNVKPAPPCNICEYVLPPCHGYYRKYDCLRPCEEDYAVKKQGVKVYRDRVQRYWEPCLTKDEKNQLDINTYAGHNVYLGIRMRRKNVDIPCW